ncbi:MAG: DUF6763 family protein [Steroidobacteraceae bacterium]
MMNEVGRAQIGQWYRHRDKGEVFQVIATDERSGTIEIQSFDGDVDEFDEAVWQGLALERAEPPEDWTGPIDDVEHDDLGYSETDMQAEDWREPLETVRPAAEAWQDERDESERDETERDAVGEQVEPSEPAAGPR